MQGLEVKEGALRGYVKRKYGSAGFTKKGAIKKSVLLQLKNSKNLKIKRRSTLALTFKKAKRRKRRR